MRLGDRRTRWFYVALVTATFALTAVAAVWRPAALIGLVAIVAAVAPVRAVLSGATGRELIAVLGGTGRLQLVWGLTVSVGLALGA